LQLSLIKNGSNIGAWAELGPRMAGLFASLIEAQRFLGNLTSLQIFGTHEKLAHIFRGAKINFIQLVGPHN